MIKTRRVWLLKASPNDDNEEFNDEDFAVLSRKFKKFFTKMEEGAGRVPKQESKEVVKRYTCTTFS